ncbi:MAG: PAS domain S-box protein, partial [Proteobacteria bacterium]|nr:PAS domain S-box protein [Pseudomonadota bacterium]
PEDPHSIGDYKVKKLFEDSEGNLWLTTAGGGLSNFDRQTERFTHYKHDPANSKSISHDNTTMVYEDHAGNLWVTTFGGGLNKFDPDTETFTVYLESDGLPNNAVMGILEDELGHLWISTFSGISKFDPATETFRNYTPADGLQSLEFNSTVAFEANDGQMFFGGINGFNAFYPEEILDNPYLPPVVLTDFQLPLSDSDGTVLSNAIGGLKELSLSYQDSALTFKFAALDYTSPKKNRYRYMLEGFEEGWNEVYSDRRYATYANLDPGEYTFKVQGSNSDGVWNEEGTSINITITPPWWGTWWFRGGSLLLILGLVGGGFVWQRETSRRREEELEATVVERTHELGERVKELQCLYGISRLASKQGATIEEILAGTVDLLPDAFQYPGIACAQIILDDQEFNTDCCQETPWSLLAAITVQGVQAGIVEVRYLEERPNVGEGPFQEDERDLLDAVAGRLGRIIERLRAREELSVKEARFRELYNGLPFPTYIWQQQGDEKILMAYNNEASVITEGKIAEFVGLNVDEMYPHRSDIKEYINRCIDEQSSLQDEMQYEFMTTGETKSLAVKYAFVPPDMALVHTEDITDRVKIEEELHASEEKYRDLVENINEVIYSLDDSGAITYVSPAIEKVLGYSPDQLIGESFDRFILPEDLDRASENISNLIGGGKARGSEYRAENASGEVRWIRVSSLPIMDEDRVSGFQGVLTDITAIKRVEEQLERAAALAERQRLARELHDSVTQTLYGIDLFSNATWTALSTDKVEKA